MILGKIFERFAQKSPVTVMLRGVLQHALPKARIDELFRRHARSQREDQLLFSSVVDVLSLVVCGTRKSVHAAYDACAESFSVAERPMKVSSARRAVGVGRWKVRATCSLSIAPP